MAICWPLLFFSSNLLSHRALNFSCYSRSLSLNEEEKTTHLKYSIFQMKIALSTLTVTISLTITTVLFSSLFVVKGLGSSSTAAVIYSTATVCGIIAGESTQRIQCYQNGKTISVLPNISFEAVSGGESFFCGLRSGGFSVFCWETNALSYSRFLPKRIYYNTSIRLTDLTVGDDQVCAREVNSGTVRCWRGENNGGSQFPSPDEGFRFHTITSGGGFACGILRNDSSVVCWGSSDIATEIQRQFKNLTMASLVAGESHACGLTKAGGYLVCKGNNDAGQSDVPFSSASEFSGLALGSKFSCAIKRSNGWVFCWGGIKESESAIAGVLFESIVAGIDFVCGLTTRNLSVICWGPGWSDKKLDSQSDLPLGMILPGPCVQDPCNVCGMYTNSEILCDGNGNICKSCQVQLPVAVALPPTTPPPSLGLQPDPSPTKAKSKLSLAFLTVGSIGAFAGICAVIFCLWAGVSGFMRKQVYNSAQPLITTVNVNAGAMTSNRANAAPIRSFSLNNQSLQKALGRQRSGSSFKITDKTENFSLPELAAATNNFSLENKIGAGSFGTVYKGKLPDGREVAIKRGETCLKAKKFQEKETAFDSEVALLTRLHHKHLVGLIGFCQENDERLLVYEYMSNGALHDHLHNKNNIEKGSSILNSWKMRIKIALDAARGLEYLHNYAVPPIIHRDIKSSNILLDTNWTAKVSDFGLSLMGPGSNQEFMSTKAVGTVGYIDPEYYVLNVLTAKSDVYGLGVVLLELLTGRKAVFKNEENGTGPIGVVEYARPQISAGNLKAVLDKKVGFPEANEAEAVELMAYTALHCVNLEGKERPNVTDIVASLERAVALCEYSQASFSTTSFSIASD